MSVPNTLRGSVIAAVLACATLPAVAQGTDDMTSAQEVRAEISEAMETIAAFSEQESEQAITEARAALDRLDVEIEQREEALRGGWADMSEDARATARAKLRDLREARNRLGERFGAIQAGTNSAWYEVQAGFSDAWTASSDAWSASDEQAPAD